MIHKEPTRLVVLRHGETAWNVQMRVQGHLDAPLTELGRWQVERAAAALADDGITRIYASDLPRAWATAQALARTSGAPLAAEPGLRERAFGTFEGLTFAEIQARWPQEAQRWRQREAGYAPGNGETLETFSARCLAAAGACAERHPGEVIALVAHGGVLDCLYRAATGLSLQERRTWHLGNAAINRLLWHGEGFTLVGWNDDAHLLQVPAGGAQPGPDPA